MANNSDCGNSGKQNACALIMPKEEIFDYDLDFDDFTFSTNVEGNAASSSSSTVRLDLMGMGFPPSLVDRAIEEKGEDDAELLVETILAYSAPCKTNSLDSVDVNDNETCIPTTHGKEPLKEEQPDVYNGASEKKISLLRMKFPIHEVESALDKLGEDASILDLVDLILAAQMADNYNKGASGPVLIDLEKGQANTTEEMFGTMEKTLVLLDMGFAEQEVSMAIEKYGSELPISELATSIVAEQCGEKYIPTSFRMINSTSKDHHSSDPLIVKKEEYALDDDISTRNLNCPENFYGKRPVEQGIDEPNNLKRPKQECDEELYDPLGPTSLEGRHGNSTSFTNAHMSDLEFKAEELDICGLENLSIPQSCRNLSKAATRPPYFFYGFLMRLSHSSWLKISKFLHTVEPEFANTEAFSALCRHESYIHNLPIVNRFRVLPEAPMTIEEAVPQMRKWIPSWDTRKKLSCINSDVGVLSQLCERLGKQLHNSNGPLSSKQVEEFIDQCEMANLMWAGHHKLAPIEPEHLERILGYPPNYTRAAASSLSERLKLLTDCFQINTLAYHLSVLKPHFAGGINLMSIYTGIGAPEIALHKLGIRMKVVVSVEPSEAKRKILKRWWESQGMDGDLVQIENSRKLTSAKIHDLMTKYGPFHFVFCQNPSSNSLKSSTSGINGPEGFDFPRFYEFSRLYQVVRRALNKKK